ncbi:MAG: O-antigen ligase family protein [Candidatus Paceibacterota bacterium]|jgi:O-antigen ligase/tetratricopeptide (TPR) repeat protein
MKLNNFLRYGIFTGLALVPFIPLVVTSSMFFPFITGKNFMFRILVLFITALWLVLMARDPSARPKSSLILWGAVALLVITSLATVFSLNPYRSFWSNYERMDGLITQIHLFLYFVVATGVLTTRRYWYQFFNINLLAATCVSFYALSQLMGTSDIHQGSTRIDATLGNAAYMAVYMLFNLFLALYLFVVATKNNWLRYIYGTLAVWFTVLLYLTQTRGTILGLVGGLFLLGLIVAWRGQGRLKKVAIGLSIGVIVLVGLFFIFKDTSLVKNSQTLSRFASISLTETTTTSRFTIWNMSLKAVAERPILGWGPEGYVYVFSKYYDPVLWKQEPWFDRSHNVFLDWLVTTGVLGLVAYLFLFGAAIYYLFRFGLLKKKDSNSIDQFEMVGAGLLVALLAAYLCHNFFVFDNLISYILFFSVLGYVHTVATENKKSFLGSKALPEWGVYAIGTLAVVLFVGALYFANLKPIIASQTLIQAISSGDTTSRLNSFTKVFSANTFGSKEALEQYLTTTPDKVFSDQKVSTAVKQTYLTLALEQIRQQLADVGPDARPFIIASNFMNSIGQSKEALGYLNQGLSFSPKKQMVYFQLASTYLNQRDFTKALDTAKQAVTLDPTYPEANITYALVAIYSGRIDLADQILSSQQNNIAVISDSRLISAYNYVKQTDQVNRLFAWRIKYYETMAQADPTNIDNYIQIYDLAITLGDRQKAGEAENQLIVILEKKIAQAPDNKDNYLTLAKVYFAQGDNTKVMAVLMRLINRYEDKIKANPRNTTNYLTLADVYAQAGRVDLAKQVIERAVSANPSFRYQAADYLKTLPAETAPQTSAQ